MFFSVIVPVYKAEKYLQRCVNSILVQSFKDFELILVDDGSPDLCPEMCDEFAKADSRVKVVHQENKGVVGARKAGVVYASGEYIVTVDSDDYIGEKFLERLKNTIAEYNCDVVVFDAVVFGGSESYRMKNSVPVGYYEQELKSICANFMNDRTAGVLNYGNLLFSLWSKAIKRDLLKKYQLKVPDIIRKGDDLAVFAPILYECTSLAVVEGMDYYYRVNPDSVMHCYSEKDVDSLSALVDYLAQYCDETYKNNLNMCAAKMYLEHIVGLINTASNYCEFKKIAKIAYDKFGSDYVQFFNAAGLRMRDRVQLYCLQQKRVFVLYCMHKINGFRRKRF